MSEHDEQSSLFAWAAWQRRKFPELDLLFAVPNGGQRHGAVAAKLKKEGVKAGVPDIFLPAPRGEYHGLFIEMKFGKNKPTQKQLRWLASLKAQGYKTAVCYSWEIAANLIIEYLRSPNVVE